MASVHTPGSSGTPAGMQQPPRRRLFGVARRSSRALGALAGVTQLGQEALAIYNNLPSGSGVNPIGSAQYPFPHNPAQENVVDPATGGNRYMDWYNAHPVRDVSGLLEWTGPNSNQLVGGLDAAHVLAANLLTEHGDTSSFYDFNATNPADSYYHGDQTPVTTAPQTYTPTTYHPTADGQTPPPDLATRPNQPPPAQPVAPVAPPVLINPSSFPKEFYPDAPPVGTASSQPDAPVPSGGGSGTLIPGGGSGFVSPVAFGGGGLQMPDPTGGGGVNGGSRGGRGGADDESMNSGRTQLAVVGAVVAVAVLLYSGRKR